MKKYFQLAVIAVASVSLAGCANFVDKVNSFSANYQATVASINADIAATAPLVATGCADIQKYAMLIAPFLPSSGKASQYLSAANAAITTYCQVVPTDIPTTVAAVTAAAKSAQNAYNSVKAGA